MISSTDLRILATARLADERVLFANQRYDGAVYICGYAVELCLKAKICDTLSWSGYPETGAEFRDLSSFKVHNLHTLLRLSGRDAFLKQNSLSEWSIVKDWNPEMRYRMIGSISLTDATDFITATATLLQRI